jgi:hypothetical protein
VDYPSLHDPYYRAPEDKEYFSFNTKPDNQHGFIEKFRCFIPPGTVLMDLNIIETGKQQAIARFGQPPTDLPLNEFFPSGSYYSLDALAKKECLVVTIA